MTAPLAWLYAIPIERLFSPAGAVRGNLMFLAIVSLWRVVLMTRVVSVVFKCRVINALVLVMLFADAVALSIIYLTPTPIFSLMGGIRLTESEQVIKSAHFMVGCGGVLTIPIWLVGGFVIVILSVTGRKTVCTWHVEASNNVRATKRVWLIAACSIAFGAALLPFAQPEQYNRWQVEHAFAKGRIDDGIRYMAQRRSTDFPLHWDPPPRFGYGDREPKLIEVLDQIALTGTTGWVRDIFVDKLRLQAGNRFNEFFGHSFRLADMSDEQLRRYVEMLESLSGGDIIAWSHDGELHRVAIINGEMPTHQRRELLQRLTAMADRYKARHKGESEEMSDSKQDPGHSPEDDPTAPADQQPQSDAR